VDEINSIINKPIIMKLNKMKSKLYLAVSLFMLIASLQSCVKDWRDGETDLSGTQPSVLIPEGGSTGNAYGAAALSLPASDESDTIYFHVNYAAKTTAPTDETITLGIDQQALADFNGTSAIQYELMPDSLYSFTTTEVIVKAGNNYSDPIPVIVHPNKIDPTKSYMLPITIVGAPSGAIISSNQKTIYYHVIGNPLAGTYLQSFYRWNDVPDTTGPPNSTVFEDEPVSVNPIDATTLDLPESYTETFAGVGISLGFTNTDGVLNNFNAFFNDIQKKAMSDALFTIVNGPTLVGYTLVGDASTHYKGTTFRTYLEVINSSGGNRKVVDNFVKQ
jgi:hypothetical protein